MISEHLLKHKRPIAWARIPQFVCGLVTGRTVCGSSLVGGEVFRTNPVFLNWFLYPALSHTLRKATDQDLQGLSDSHTEDGY